MRTGLKKTVFEAGAVAYDVLTDHGMWRTRIGALIDGVSELPDAPRVLDLGCGPGVSAFVLAERLGPEAEVVGVDLSRRMIERARRHHTLHEAHLANVSFHEADATALAFADDRFDLVFGHSFLYLVPDRPAVLAEALRVLAPGGSIALMEPNDEGSVVRAGGEGLRHLGEAMWRPIDASRFAASMVAWRLFSGMAGRLTVARVEQLFGEAGFVDVQVTETIGGLGLHCIGRKARVC